MSQGVRFLKQVNNCFFGLFLSGVFGSFIRQVALFYWGMASLSFHGNSIFKVVIPLSPPEILCCFCFTSLGETEVTSLYAYKWLSLNWENSLLCLTDGKGKCINNTNSSYYIQCNIQQKYFQYASGLHKTTSTSLHIVNPHSLNLSTLSLQNIDQIA